MREARELEMTVRGKPLGGYFASEEGVPYALHVVVVGGLSIYVNTRKFINKRAGEHGPNIE